MDLARYTELFLTESREQLSAINNALLDLERTGDPVEVVGTLFRAVHTLKGMSATLGYGGVTELAHEMESLLDRVRAGEHVVTAATVDALLAGADALEASVERAVAGESVEADTAAAAERLRVLAGVHRTGVRGVRLPVAAPPGPGVLVRVRQAPTVEMPGVRAAVLLARIAELGEITAVAPPRSELEAAEEPVEFAVRVQTAAAAADIEAHVRAGGEVDTVVVGEAVLSAAAATTAARSSAREPTQLNRSVRVDVSRLDGLMNLVGELVIARGRVAELARRMEAPALDEAVSHTSRLIGELQEEMLAARLVPLAQVFDRFPRFVRDASRATGKEVLCHVEGKHIELDRSVVEELGDPLVHLVRNAIDHGIEPPAERAAAGKAREGRLVLSATRDQSAVVIRVEDDGRGVNRERVRARALEMDPAGVPAGPISDEELLKLLARPGLSTAAQVTELSGRGVGVDAVVTRVRELGGTLELRTVEGAGTKWTLRLPLTLAIVRALLVRVGGERYALPVTHVIETLDLSAESLHRIRGQEVLLLRGDALPLHRLRVLLGLDVAEVMVPQVVVVGRGDKRAGIVVDELTGQQEIVVKHFDAVRGSVPLFSGATILPDGAPALILDVGSLL